MRITPALVLISLITLAFVTGCPSPETSEPPPAPSVSNMPPSPEPPAEPAAADLPEYDGPQPSREYRIALIMKTMSNPFFQKMEEGAQAAADELGIELTPTAAPKETDDEKQAALVENAIADQADAIIIAPCDSKTLIPALLQANQAGIPVINLDNRIDPEAAAEAGLELVTFIGPDNAEGAEKAAAHLMEAMGGSGTVAMLEGIRGVDNADNRKLGFERALKANPDIELADSQSAHWALEEAETVFSNMLTAHPDITGLFCANDMMALGAMRAVEAQGKTGEILVAAYDNLDEVQDSLASGALLCTVEQHPDFMGAYGVRSAVMLLEGSEVPKEIAVPTDLITAPAAH